jgi:NAD(P)-dependent dehydrogenase (short-subunit alcohol dehydrogenase family)
VSRRLAVVVGGTSGIGHATCAEFVSAGWDVVAAALHAPEVAAGSRAETADRSLTYRTMDVRDPSQVAAVFGDLAATRGSLDALAWCAGIQTYGDAPSTSVECWDETMAVNARGAFLCCRAALPLLRHRPGSSITLVSSVQSMASQQDVVAYDAASKGALGALGRAMAVDEAPHGVRVNVVSPGSVDTSMLRASAEKLAGDRPVEEVLREWGRTHPLGRIANPVEIARVIRFLAEDNASFVTGVDLRVDGGLLAQLAVASPSR